MAIITQKVEYEVGDYVMTKDGFEGFVISRTYKDGYYLLIMNMKSKKTENVFESEVSLKKEPNSYNEVRIDRALELLGWSLSVNVSPQQADKDVKSALKILFEELKGKKLKSVGFDVQGYICPKGPFGKAIFHTEELKDE